MAWFKAKRGHADGGQRFRFTGQARPAQAQAGATVTVCGTVSAFTAATAVLPGSVTIAGQPFVIAAGTTLTGQGLANAEVKVVLPATPR